MRLPPWDTSTLQSEWPDCDTRGSGKRKDQCPSESREEHSVRKNSRYSHSTALSLFSSEGVSVSEIAHARYKGTSSSLQYPTVDILCLVKILNNIYIIIYKISFCSWDNGNSATVSMGNGMSQVSPANGMITQGNLLRNFITVSMVA